MKFFISLSCALAFILSACGDDGRATPGVDSGMGADTGTTVPMCSTTDGMTACSSVFCPANEWCDTIICQAGCQSASNCAAGEMCDKAGATGIDAAGVCRPCGTDGGAPMDAGTTNTCEDVMGNYRLVAKLSNPEQCSQLELPPGATSVTQAGTTVTFTIGSDGTTFDCTLDSTACSCTGSMTVEGMTVAVEWKPQTSSLSLRASGIICNFDVNGPL